MRLVLAAGALAAVCTWAQTTPPVPKVVPAPVQQGKPGDKAQPAEVQQSGKVQQPDQDAVQSLMAISLAKQRVAAMLQIAAVMNKKPTPAASFFTVPWIETPVPFSQPPCDPLPAAELDKLVEEGAKLEGLKPELIRGVITEESGGRPCAVSWKGAQGLMQLMPATSEEFGVKDPFDPHQNVEAGTKLLKQLMTKYKDDVSLALAAYNAGEARVDRDGGVPQIPETKNYVNDIKSKLPQD
jgi:soluble lytic murein transglycosylase-like protein